MGQVRELKISRIMVEAMFKAAMGDIERFNRKFMILSGFEVAGYSDTIPATLSASLSAQARDKCMYKNLDYCTLCKVMG